MYEICGQQLTLGEFKLILQEMCHFEMNANRHNLGDRYFVFFSHYCEFFGMNDDDIIPPPIKTSIANEFNNVYYIQYPTDFFVYFHRNKTTISGKAKQKCQKLASCMVIEKMKHCRGNDNFLDKYTNNKLKSIENHLIINDHESLLPFGDCKYGIKCPQFIQLLRANQSKDVNIKVRIHMHLFRHPSHHLVINSKVYNTNTNMNTNQCFTYVDINTYESPNMLFTARDCCEFVLDDNKTVAENLMLVLLIQEVIKNGKAGELVQKSDLQNYKLLNNTKLTKLQTHLKIVLAKYQILDIINIIFENKYKHMSQILLIENINDTQRLISTNWDNLMQELRKEYTLLDKLFDKMKHPRHTAMGSPLSKQRMFAVILYTDTECHASLIQELRQYNQKDIVFAPNWKHFDSCLYYAISTLCHCEKHDANIFTGLTDVYLDETKFDDQYSNHLLLKTYQSFSQDLSVAERFRGSDGLIIGVNLKRIKTIEFDTNCFVQCEFNYNTPGKENLPEKFVYELKEDGAGLLCCDVSWISKFPTEKEVLVAKHSLLPINKKQIYWTQTKDKRQYAVCDPCNSENVSFQSMFGIAKYTNYKGT